MITAKSKGSTFAYNMLGDFEYYYQDIHPEILPLLKQLDITYEPDDKANSQVEEVYYSSLVTVTIRGSVRLLDQLYEYLRNRDDLLFGWVDRNPWFLTEGVDLADVDEGEARFLLEKYGDAIPEDLRADFSALLAG